MDFDANDNQVRQVDPHYGGVDDDAENAPAGSASYDAMDRPLVVADSDTSVDPAGERTAYAYDAAGRVVKTTTPKGVLSAAADDHATAYVYDDLDRVVRQSVFGTGPTEARTTHFCYDLAGDLRSVTAPRATRDTVSCPAASDVPFTSRLDYDVAHRVTAQTDPLGHETRLTYDANGNVTSTAQDIDTGPDPDRVARTTRSFDERDLPIETRESFNTGHDVVTRTDYDKNGNPSREISPRAYDAAGGTAPFTDYVTSYVYDKANRLTRVDLPSDANDGTERQYVHRAYDADGRLVWTSLPVTSASAADVADTARTRTTWFDPGWIATSDDPVNPKVHFDYTAQGLQSERVPEDASGGLDDGLAMAWSYFADGQLKTRSDRGGQASVYTWDADDNLTGADEAAGLTDPTEKAIDTQATYTAFGEVAKVRFRKQGDTNWKFADYRYDEDGNVTLRRENGEETDTGTQTKAPRRYELSYDGADWLTRQLDLGTDDTCKDDQRIVTSYWDTGWERQRDVYRAGSGCTADTSTWPKKTTTRWTQFDNGKLNTLVTENGAGQTTESHDVGYLDDGVYVDGNRTSDHYVLKRADGNTATTCVPGSPCDAAYPYDARDRLTTDQIRAGKQVDYTLDEPGKLIGDSSIRAGNVTTETRDGATTTRRYQAGQLKEATAGGATVKYWYDRLGNLDCVTTAAGTQGDCSPSDGGAPANLVTDYSYDYLNRVSAVRSYSGGGTRTDVARYVYDAIDRLTKETEDHAGSGNDRSTAFTFQGLDNLVTEEKQSGGTAPATKTFSYDSSGHKIGMIDRDNGTGATDSYTLGRDVHGSISQLLDDAGKVTASYGYDAYGGQDAPSSDSQALTTGDTNNQAPVNPYRYAGKRADSGTATSPSSTAQLDMGSRRYGPDTTRFLQQDQFAGALADLGLAADPLTQNRYGLAGGNPISFVEIDGHMLAPDGGGGAVTTPSLPPPSSEPKHDDTGTPAARSRRSAGRSPACGTRPGTSRRHTPR